ncbi:hypothetical protein [Streptomyces sp. Isolate_45]|uniref:hypothetical protein n=1 Tax=Streptomyces sp. Isolate_45 TaxID=2950111 RepID=UPI0024820BA9|nr:hypothetical protein [Streptomyces sp. Isolate_45]MDA5279871.1 hypothetical protein [Streptomyces sp. Isolate_45]
MTSTHKKPGRSATSLPAGGSSHPPVDHVSIGQIARVAVGLLGEGWNLMARKWGTVAELLLGEDEGEDAARFELGVDDDYDLYLISQQWALTPHIFSGRYDTVADIAGEVARAAEALAVQVLTVAGGAGPVEDLFRAEEALLAERSAAPGARRINGAEMYADLLGSRIQHAFLPAANAFDLDAETGLAYVQVSDGFEARQLRCVACGSQEGLVALRHTPLDTTGRYIGSRWYGPRVSESLVCRLHHAAPSVRERLTRQS